MDTTITTHGWLPQYLADDPQRARKKPGVVEDVSAEMGFRVDPATLANVARTKNHRMLDLSICGSEGPGTLAIAEAYERVLNSRLGDYMGMLQANNGLVRIINRPSLARASGGAALIGEILLRTAIGFLLGIRTGIPS